jgi:hypothetical protein
MSKDLKKLDQRESKQESDQLTEASMAVQALTERTLFGAKPRPQSDSPRIILALDCTSSMDEFIEERKITPEAATIIADALFAKAAGLQVQLAYFRGDDQSAKQPRQLRVSNKWYTTPEELARAIAAIEHWPGWTQHCRLLRHVAEEAEKHAIQQVIVLTDAFERQTPGRPHGDDFKAAQVHAQRCADFGTKIVFGYKGTIQGGCPLDRAGVNAERAFRDIASESGGACFLFNPATLAERFGELASQAALAAKGDTAAAKLQLQHFQTIPFDMQTNVVGAQVPRCKTGED